MSLASARAGFYINAGFEVALYDRQRVGVRQVWRNGDSHSAPPSANVKYPDSCDEDFLRSHKINRSEWQASE